MTIDYNFTQVLSTPAFSTASRTNYEPLVNPSHDLRLLRVLREKCKGRLQAYMWNESIAPGDDSVYPKYRCLSYTWGEPDNLHAILVKGYHVQIKLAVSTRVREAISISHLYCKKGNECTLLVASQHGLESVSLFM